MRFPGLSGADALALAAAIERSSLHPVARAFAEAAHAAATSAAAPGTADTPTSNFRALWIQRINAAARLEGLSYSRLMGALHAQGIEINRKVLADLAVNHPEAFKAIVAKVK